MLVKFASPSHYDVMLEYVRASRIMSPGMGYDGAWLKTLMFLKSPVVPRFMRKNCACCNRGYNGSQVKAASNDGEIFIPEKATCVSYAMTALRNINDDITRDMDPVVTTPEELHDRFKEPRFVDRVEWVPDIRDISGRAKLSREHDKTKSTELLGAQKIQAKQRTDDDFDDDAVHTVRLVVDNTSAKSRPMRFDDHIMTDDSDDDDGSFGMKGLPSA